VTRNRREKEGKAMPLRRLLAPAIFLACLTWLPVTAFGESSTATSEETEEEPLPRLDFEFEEKRMSVGLRGGWALNRSKGAVYDDLTDWLTLSKSDFDAPAFTFDFSYRLVSWMDVVLGFEFGGREQKSEDRNFTQANGNPIEQKTTLTQVPLTISLRIYPIGRGEQVGQYAWIRKAVVPYIGGGIGGTWYELRLKGDFVDLGDPDIAGDEFIFSDEFTSDAWAFAQHAFVGVDIKLTRRFGLVLEGRYYWADADLRGDFEGYNSIDLDGARAMLGFNWKF
jgi:opacity protein-like surface antigen